MHRAVVFPLGVLLVLFLPACEELDILGPTPPDQGVVIYVHADFSGPSQALNVDVRDFEKVEGPCSHGEEGEKPTWSDCMSSVRVQPGWSATLYKDRDFEGASVTITSDAPNLRAIAGSCDGSFNDCVSSITVRRLP